jgi:Glycosyl transferase family 21
VAVCPPPTLAAIVPATDGRPTLERCLAAIRAAREPPDQLIAVTDPQLSSAAAARNAGGDRAGADVLVFIDSDVVVHADAFQRLRRAFAADPELSAIFGSYDERPEARGVVSSFRNLLHHHVHQTAAGRATTFWCGLGAVRRRDFERVGGFDARLSSMEDIDLGLRLASRGARIVLDPDLQGTHLKRWGLREMVRADFAARGMPWVALLLRQRSTGSRAAPDAPPPARALNLSWRHRLSALASLVGVAALLLGRPRAALSAVAALLALNRAFYALLARRAGVRGLAAGVVLHVLHHLIALAAVPAGAVLYLRWRRSDSTDARNSCLANKRRALTLPPNR